MKELTLSKRQKNITLATVFTLAGVVYCLISLVNHYLFKTYALDLGLYTHALYDYAHFRAADCSMFKAVEQNLLSDHFDLYLVILSPLVYLFGSYTLLFVQIAAVLLGGWGVFKLIGLYSNDDWLPILAAATFFFSFGVIHPFAFDYHSNVLTAMMLPWLLYYFKRRKFGLASLFVVLFVIGKENMSLWLFFVVIALMWDYKKDGKALLYLAGYAVFAGLYFVIINMVVMPRLGGTGGGFTRYAYLGSNYGEVARRLVTHPLETLRILFTNTSTLPQFDGVKAEFYCCVLASGLILALLKPNYLLMLVPLVGQKMLKEKKWRLIVASCLLLSTVLTTFYTVGVPKSIVWLDHVCVYQGRHYEQRKFDAQYARQLVKQIPDDASVSAASMFVPHLALREKVYDLDNRPNPHADYVLITRSYFDKIVYWKKVFPDRDEYETIATDSTIYLLRRIAP